MFKKDEDSSMPFPNALCSIGKRAFGSENVKDEPRIKKKLHS